jgi:hypothetical protein
VYHSPPHASCWSRSSASSPPWNRLTTIRYNDELYELDREEQGRPPRPFVYRLKKLPLGKIIRGVHHYQPEETLQKPGWAPLFTPSPTPDSSVVTKGPSR